MIIEITIVFLKDFPIKIDEATGIINKVEIKRTPTSSIKIEIVRAKTIVIASCNLFTLIPDIRA